MSDHQKTLDLLESDDGYVLRKTSPKGKVSEFRLSDSDILTLAASVPQIASAVAAKQNPATNPVSALEVVDIRLKAMSTATLAVGGRSFNVVCQPSWGRR